MTDVKYDAELCERLEREAREDAATIKWADDHFANGPSWPECGHDEATCPCFTENDKARSVLAKATLRTRDNLTAMADQLAAARAEIERYRADLAVAAGECLVPVDEMPPGSHLRRVVMANRMWRYERDRMQLVVDAALASYGSQRGGHFGPRPTDAMLELADAVDAYRAARGKEGR